MPAEAIMICSRGLDSTDLSVARLLDFFGVRYRVIDPNSRTFRLDHLTRHTGDGDRCLLVNCRTIATFLENSRDAGPLRSFVQNCVSYMLLYDISPTDLDTSAIGYLTNGIIESVSGFDGSDHEYEVSEDFEEICGQFSGMTFGPINDQSDFRFNVGNESSDVCKLISIDGRPFFTKVNVGTCDAFLVASNRVLDIKTKLSTMIEVSELFSQIVPEMMFVRYVYGDQCWHSSIGHACLIVDDPLLKERYGFLEYRKLLEEMDKHNFSTSIAFIPWNFKRTSPETARLFKHRPDRFSICVHGCDHTRNEFGSIDPEEMDARIKLATTRMACHERLSGLGFDEVMVFPQGRFSRQSMQMLKSNNYLAAINSGAFPVNESEGLEIAYLLEPAITRYDGFPLFLRRYPGELLDVAFDLFLGKPILIVVHHDYFEEGYRRLVDFVDKINSLDESIRWTGPSSIAERSYLQRRAADDVMVTRVFAGRAIMDNPNGHAMKHRITKDEPDRAAIRSVVVNGEEVSYDHEDGLLAVELGIQPRDRVVLEIRYRSTYECIQWKQTRGERFGVFARRRLSEIRDNYISKNGMLLSIAKRIVDSR